MAKRTYRPPTLRQGSSKVSVVVIHKTHIVFNTKKALRSLGSWVVGRIKLRTQMGYDAKGKPFTKYSNRYEKALRRGGEQSTPIDLRVSGTMMGDLKVTGRGKRHGVNYVTVGFGNKKVRRYKLKNNQIQFTGEGKISTGYLAAIHHRGYGKMPKRRFMGITKAEKVQASMHALKQSIVMQLSGPPRRLPR